MSVTEGERRNVAPAEIERRTQICLEWVKHSIEFKALGICTSPSLSIRGAAQHKKTTFLNSGCASSIMKELYCESSKKGLGGFESGLEELNAHHVVGVKSLICMIKYV